MNLLSHVYGVLATSNHRAGWPNGKALDFGSRDCRFDPCVGHHFCPSFLLINLVTVSLTYGDRWAKISVTVDEYDEYVDAQ